MRLTLAQLTDWNGNLCVRKEKWKCHSKKLNFFILWKTLRCLSFQDFASWECVHLPQIWQIPHWCWNRSAKWIGMQKPKKGSLWMSSIIGMSLQCVHLCHIVKHWWNRSADEIVRYFAKKLWKSLTKNSSTLSLFLNTLFLSLSLFNSPKHSLTKILCLSAFPAYQGWVQLTNSHENP